MVIPCSTVRNNALYYPKSDDNITDSEHVENKNVIGGFMRWTTIHGLHSIFKSKGIFKNVLWITVVLSASGLFIYQLNLITRTFASYPVKTVLIKQSARTLDFPAVTVCNTNPIKSSTLYLDPRLNALVNSWDYAKKRKKREASSYYYVDNKLGNPNQKVNRHHLVKRQFSPYQCSNVTGYGFFCLIKVFITPTDAAERCSQLSSSLGATYQLASMETLEKKTAIINDPDLFNQIAFYRYYHIGLTWDGSQYQWQSGVPYSSYTNDFSSTYIQGSNTYMRAKVTGNHLWLGADSSSSYVLCEDTTVYTTPVAYTTTPSPTSAFEERQPLREDFLQENELLETVADIPLETKTAMGYSYDEFILSCKYDNVNCNKSTFGQFYDPVHGNCYVFNSGWVNDIEQIFAKKPGRGNGLKMTFNLGQHEYIPGVAQSAGVVIVVHHRDRMPFPEDEGVFAIPSHLTSVGINKVSISRLGGSYSNCTYETSNPEINVFEEYHNVKYSSLACYKTCYQKYVIQKCNCADPQYPNKGQAFSDADVPFCNARNITQDDCMYGVLIEYITDILKCTCPNPCMDTTYRYSLTKSQWPSDVYLNKFITENSAQMQSLLNYSSTSEYVLNNLASFELYFKELNYERIYEVPRYGVGLWFADVASILGLWLGMSVLSVFEFFELLTDLIVVRCCKTKKQFDSKPGHGSTNSIDISEPKALTDANTSSKPTSQSSIMIHQFHPTKYSVGLHQRPIKNSYTTRNLNSDKQERTEHLFTSNSKQTVDKSKQKRVVTHNGSSISREDIIMEIDYNAKNKKPKGLCLVRYKKR